MKQDSEDETLRESMNALDRLQVYDFRRSGRCLKERESVEL